MLNFWELLQASIDMVMQVNGAKILITGDLNADLNSAEGSNLEDFSTANGLTIHIRQPTRISLVSVSILDQFISNFPQMVKSTDVLDPVGSSDHCLIEACLLFRKRKHLSYKRRMWQFSKTDFKSYKEAIHNYNWNDCLALDDINSMANTWTENLLTIAKATIPNKLVTVRPDDKPWYNNHLRHLSLKKNRHYKQFKKDPSDVSWNRYKEARNIYIRELTLAKEQHENEKYDFLRNDSKSSKKWWSIVRSVQKNNEAFEAIPPIHVNDDIITDDREKANAFNDFFLSASSLEDNNAVLPNDQGWRSS